VQVPKFTLVELEQSASSVFGQDVLAALGSSAEQAG
jgi:hypothetical protein